MYGALLTEAATAEAHAGILFMHNEGWSTMCGHGIIAVTTIALDRGLITAGSDDIRYDTPAGLVVARAHRAPERDGARVRSVSFVNVPSFVFEAGLPIAVGGRTLRVDIACDIPAPVSTPARAPSVNGARCKKKFTEPVALSSTRPTDRPLPRRAVR